MPTQQTPLNTERLLELLESVGRSLSHLSAVARLPYVYGDDDAMKKLVVEYKSLSSADSAAFEAVKEASELVKADGLTYEQRVKQFGEEEARRHGKPHTDAVETRRLTLKALNKFRDEHPLIAAIVDGTTCRA